MASKREWPLWHATSDMTEEEKNEAIDRFLEWRFPNRKEAPRSQDQSDTDVAIFERVLRNSSGRAVATFYSRVHSANASVLVRRTVH